MTKRTRRRKGKEYPTEWPHVHLFCACKGGNTIAIGRKALERYDEAKGEECVMKCPQCKTWATWEVVDGDSQG